ncbi:MAG TPA: cell division protein FtsW [Rhodospirillaceae bacterium]|nr:MAG: cell division protein FtsW [Alphaproteobacteria bacterium GWF2_58_20]HAU30001.1 cell division protein FtsW [Rhodospirillaceae bacterium]
MPHLARTDTSMIGQWWWTVDRWLLAAILLLMAMGIMFVAAASPPVAIRIGLPSYYFIKRHVVLLGVSFILMMGTSLLSPRGVRRTGLALLVVFIPLMIATLLFGAEVKGGRRWIYIMGFSLQPSEFIKPAFAIVAAWLFAKGRCLQNFPGTRISIGLYAVIVSLLLMQPDLGMTVVVTAIWGCQFFLAGMPIMLVIGLGLLGLGGIGGAYMFLPHVTSRIDRFLDPASGDTYQVQRSLEAFSNGGLFGTGPGQGQVKWHLPDAHADFIFSVAGEEFGMIMALGIIALYAFIVLRGMSRILHSEDLFVLLAGGGLLTQFALQAMIHMGSSLHLIPTKGMTLPFISYGGSSLLALGLGMGMILSLTRKRPGGALS